ncbi:MAG: CysZ protein [Oleiphilaceae bacterium]|jgi:CysZ protein
MNGNVFRGFSYLILGFKIICQPKFRLFLLVPFCVNIALFTVLIIWAKSLFSGWMAALLNWMPEWLGFMEWLFWGIYFIMILMVLFYGFITAANLIGAPFYGYLAEMTEKHLTGKDNEIAFSWKELAKLIPSTVMRELQKILYYLPRVLGLFILGFIPGLNIFAALGWIVFSSWMMAMQYIDYPADNHNMSFSEMRNYLSAHRLTALGFGVVVFGATLIPLLNFLALPAAVCGAVAFWANENSALGNSNMEIENRNTVNRLR